MNETVFLEGKCGVYDGPIIDFHTHLHLKLHRKGNRWESSPDRPDPLVPILRQVIWRNFERSRYLYSFSRGSPLEKPMEKALFRIVRGITPETDYDLLKRMDNANIAQSVVLALPPIIENEEILACCKKNPRLIPFISPNPKYEPKAQIEKLLAAGGRGIKIHPLLQDIQVGSEFSKDVARMAAKFDVPLVFHVGGTTRLFGMTCIRRPNLEEFVDLAKAVPDAKIVLAHVGLWEFPQVLNLVKDIKNVLVDISFQAPHVIRKCVKTLGASRVLLGSDSPIGRVKIILENIALAKLDLAEITCIVFENARRLLEKND